jgi:hypothetical protein
VLKPLWATAAAVGHGDWMSKVQNFQTVVYFCKMILKIYKKNYVSFLKKLLRVEILFLFCEILAIVDIDVFSLGKMKTVGDILCHRFPVCLLWI